MVNAEGIGAHDGDICAKTLQRGNRLFAYHRLGVCPHCSAQKIDSWDSCGGKHNANRQ